jgi:hypothetical protein
MLMHVNHAGTYKPLTRGGWVETGDNYNLGPLGLSLSIGYHWDE